VDQPTPGRISLILAAALVRDAEQGPLVKFIEFERMTFHGEVKR
jgi:hypothetical protein